MKAVDLFAGCGGLSLGLQKSGIEVVAAYENWEPAINIYRLNFPHEIHTFNLSDVESAVKHILQYEPDLIAGGPPCQDFSSAGKRDEDNGKGDLTVSYAEVVAKVKPEWFIMENVERIIKTNKLVEAKRIFKKVGYGLSSAVLDASYCKVPQARKRFFLIGHLYSSDKFLDYYLQKNLSKKPMTVYDYLGESLGLEYYYRHPRSYQRRGIFSIHEPSPTIRGVNRPIPKGYKNHQGDPIKVNNSLRALTTIERSYIQTFPVDFNFVGNKTELEQIIGNAVPVNLAKYIGNCIKEYINSNGKMKYPQQAELELQS
jgi:DNA (cytosine-5)-methyltransferase 1